MKKNEKNKFKKNSSEQCTGCTYPPLKGGYKVSQPWGHYENLKICFSNKFVKKSTVKLNKSELCCTYLIPP